MGLINEKIGGGEVFDGSRYYQYYRGATSPVTSAEWKALPSKGYEYVNQPAYEGYADSSGRIYMRDKTISFMPQVPVPEYELEGRVSTDKHRREAEEFGYSDRVQSKINTLERSTNRSIGSMNSAKADHVKTLQDINQWIGAPDPSAYKGFTNGSVNQGLQYAIDKANDGAASAKSHMANASASAARVKAAADAQGVRLQADFDKAGGQATHAMNMQKTIGHLMQREEDDAATTRQPVTDVQPQASSVFAQNTQFQSIFDWLKA